LRGVDLIVSDPRMHRLAMRSFAAAVKGKGTPVTSLLWELAKGLSVDELVAVFARLTHEDIRAALAYGAALAREEELPAAAAAGLAEGLPAGISMEAVRAHAATVLGELAAGRPRDELLERHPALSGELVAAVLRYGASLARNDPLAAPPEPPEERFLRDMLSEPDRTLVEQILLYWEETKGPAIPEYDFPRWKRLVEQVEQDQEYTDDVLEYGNELYARGWLEEWLSVVSPSGKERWLELIMPLDRRFESATRYIGRPVVGPEAKPQRWWWYRMPKRLSEASERSFPDPL
jgi:uncharacterized protein (DUF433 family)